MTARRRDAAAARVVVTGMGAADRARQRRRRPPGRAWSPGRSGVRTIEAFDPSRVDLADRRRGPRLRRRAACSTARTCGGPTATSSSGWWPPARRSTRPGCPARFEGELAERTGVILGTGLGGVGTLIDGVLDERRARPRPDQPVLHPDGHPQRRGRPGRDPVRDDRAQLRDRVGLRDRRPRDRRGLGDDPARRRRRDGRRRRRGRRSTRRSVGGFAAMRALSTRNDDPAGASRPFDAGRDGFVIGEGAGVARPRGARARRGARRDARWPSSSATARPPTPRTSRCRRRAGSARSGPPGGRSRRPVSTPADIDHVNAHATSTPEGDKAELQAIRTIFGDARRAVAVTANKSMLGHTLGAAGAIEAIVSIQTIRDGLRPADDQPERPGPEAPPGST